MPNKNFYITTTLPYINAEPHIGFAKEIINADVIARYHALKGDDIFFNTGTDEHGLKIYQKAQGLGVSVDKYCDDSALKFKVLQELLNLSCNSFIRTTDVKHVAAAQEFWRRCEKNGDIYKKKYSTKYCVGCELEKTDSELVDGRCPLHPNAELEIIDEENYFFRFSAYQKKLLKFYEENPEFVVPNHRFNEIKNFVAGGLQDFSVSRLKEKMPWGITVPGDDNQVMYVWFDALVNYISCLGWPNETAEFKNFWPGVQVCGKDNLRQQTAIWQAMLMSAGVANSKQVLVFGFLTLNGQKISKSLGNTIDPRELVEKYGVDPVRYYLLKEVSTFEDGDFSYEKMEKLYNADLANGLGNLVARTSNLLEKNEIELQLVENSDTDFSRAVFAALDEYNFSEALKIVWEKIKQSDEFLSQTTPWKMTEKEQITNTLRPVAQNILNIAYCLQAFLPETAKKILRQFSYAQVKKGDSLFPKIV
ncbi:MAG: methionine--tRNA ligase [Candidatus Falkowbacteria bacterium]